MNLYSQRVAGGVIAALKPEPNGFPRARGKDLYPSMLAGDGTSLSKVSI